MRVIHGPFAAIESALFDALTDRERFAPARVIAPSARLVRHLKVAAAERFPDGLFGVHFMHLFHLALESAPADRALVREALSFERLVSGLLRERMADAPYLGRCTPTYDVAAALLGAIRDLKDAGVEPDPGLIAAAMNELLEEKITTLTEFDIRKLTDVMILYKHYEDALRACGEMDASDLFKTAQPPPMPTFVYGFYDMTQVQWELVRRMRDVTMLVPYEPGPMVFADKFFKSFACAGASSIEAVTDAAPDPRVEVFNAAGERDEVWGVAKRILASGVRPDRIGVVARTMEPYARHIERIFEDNRIPFIPPRGRPLADEPEWKYKRTLFRLGLDDFPRGATLDVLRSPFFGGSDTRWWSAITAARRIGRGRATWLSRLDGAVRLTREEGALDIPESAVRELRAAFERLCAMVDAVPPRAAWSAYARIYGFEMPDGESTHSEFHEAFERDLERREAPVEPRGGVTVTDVMGARGLRFHTLFVLGLNSHAFPRFILEEPFISDAARRDVFEVRGHKIAVRHEGYDEERLLFHLMRRAATDRLVLVYQRTDADGKTRDRSPFVPDEGEPIPRSPRRKLEGLAPELLTREEALLLGATDAAMRVFGRDAERFARAKRVIAKLEGPKLSAHEGRVGKLPRPKRMSPTRIESFNACGFQYFAEYVLGLFPLDDPEEAEDLDAMQIGTLEHRGLELHYKEEIPVAEAVERAFAEGPPVLFPALREARKRQMVRHLEAFTAWERSAWTPAEFEVEVAGHVAGFEFRGRVDRIDRDGKRRRIVDYKRRKSGAFPAKLPTLAEDARKVQAPIYVKLAGADEAAFFFVEEPARSGDEKRYVLDFQADWWKTHGRDFEKLLRGLGDRIEAGRFEIAPGAPCRFCDFKTVCRKNYLTTQGKLG